MTTFFIQKRGLSKKTPTNIRLRKFINYNNIPRFTAPLKTGDVKCGPCLAPPRPMLSGSSSVSLITNS